MFGTTLNREYAIAADLLDLDEPASPSSPAPPCARRSPGRTCRPGCSREIDEYARRRHDGLTGVQERGRESRPRKLILCGASPFVSRELWGFRAFACVSGNRVAP